MKKPLVTLLAILGALAAAAALLFVFRDKIKALFEDIKGKCCCKCDKDVLEEDESEDAFVEDFEEAPAAEAELPEEPELSEEPAAEEAPAEE